MLDRFHVEKDGVFTGIIEASDARLAGREAIVRFGGGIYEIRMLREDEPAADPQPYDRGEEGYLAHVRGGAR